MRHGHGYGVGEAVGDMGLAFPAMTIDGRPSTGMVGTWVRGHLLVGLPTRWLKATGRTAKDEREAGETLVRSLGSGTGAGAGAGVEAETDTDSACSGLIARALRSSRNGPTSARARAG
jgi:hypothetical protein